MADPFSVPGYVPWSAASRDIAPEADRPSYVSNLQTAEIVMIARDSKKQKVATAIQSAHSRN